MVLVCYNIRMKNLHNKRRYFSNQTKQEDLKWTIKNFLEKKTGGPVAYVSADNFHRYRLGEGGFEYYSAAPAPVAFRTSSAIIFLLQGMDIETKGIVA